MSSITTRSGRESKQPAFLSENYVSSASLDFRTLLKQESDLGSPEQKEKRRSQTATTSKERRKQLLQQRRTESDSDDESDDEGYGASEESESEDEENANDDKDYTPTHSTSPSKKSSPKRKVRRVKVEKQPKRLKKSQTPKKQRASSSGSSSSTIPTAATDVPASSSSQNASFPETIDYSQPVLLWVDDIPNNNVKFINRIERRRPGVQVFQVLSTEDGISFLRKHKDTLEQNGTPFRIITDRTRNERKVIYNDTTSSATSMFNSLAGEELIRWIRENGIMTDVMLFCTYFEDALYLESMYPSVRVSRSPQEGVDFGAMRPLSEFITKEEPQPEPEQQVSEQQPLLTTKSENESMAVETSAVVAPPEDSSFHPPAEIAPADSAPLVQAEIKIKEEMQ